MSSGKTASKYKIKKTQSALKQSKESFKRYFNHSLQLPTLVRLLTAQALI